jgi:hypothetical protein
MAFQKCKIFLKRKSDWKKYGSVLRLYFISKLVINLLIVFFCWFFSSISSLIIGFHLIFISNLILILLISLNPSSNWILFQFHYSSFDFNFFHVEFDPCSFYCCLFCFGSFFMYFIFYFIPRYFFIKSRVSKVNTC